MHREQWSEKENAKGRERKRKVSDEEDEGRRLRERKRESRVGPSYLRPSRKASGGQKAKQDDSGPRSILGLSLILSPDLAERR
ncbi:hypothetical protein G5I_06735 [Acromyrmex echinatior]|uniref:Uncharacterized protein n=1 Tax=Acromyrmex echinatior TaxID=103372 RepID=F4WLV4_ACREC|nr:hypothetical protein G5I_06735 [Acromyrmex echinatior]